jgi:hypothetical protein
LKEETLDCTVCRTGFGGGSGSLVRRTIQWVVGLISGRHQAP